MVWRIRNVNFNSIIYSNYIFKIANSPQIKQYSTK